MVSVQCGTSSGDSPQPLLTNGEVDIEMNTFSSSTDSSFSLRQASSGFEASFTLHDFDEVAALNVWTRLQKTLSWGDVIAVYLLENAFWALRMVSLYFVIFVEDGVRDGENFELEQSLALTILVGSYVVNLYQKYRLDKLLHRWTRAVPTTMEKLKFFCLCNFRLISPIRYIRSVYNFFIKSKIIGRDFVHGRSVTFAEVLTVARIIKDDQEIARDELYGCFIQLIPMTILQICLFQHVKGHMRICTEREGFRFLLILLNLICVCKSTVIYEWRKRLHVNALHVHGYLITNGQYPIPQLAADRLTTFLDIIINSSSIVSRVLMITFMAAADWLLLVACITFFVAAHSAVVFLSSYALLSNVENIPEGITLYPSYIADRWVHVFYGKDLRVQYLSRQKVKFSERHSFRVPLVLAQWLIFFVVFFMLGLFAVIYNVDHLRDAAAMNAKASSVNGTASAEDELYSWEDAQGNNFTHFICPNHNHNKSTNPLNVFDVSSSMMYSLGGIFNVGFNTIFGFLNPLNFYFLLSYLQIIAVCVRMLYVRRKPYRITEALFPPIVSASYLRAIFKKIFEIEDEAKRLRDLRNLLFLISVDAQTFHHIYLEHNPVSESWWEEQIDKEFLRPENSERVSARYAQLDFSNEEDLRCGNEMLLFQEMEVAHRLTQDDRLASCVFGYFSRKLESVIFNEMSSLRLYRTIELLEFDEKEICKQAMKNVAI